MRSSTNDAQTKARSRKAKRADDQAKTAKAARDTKDSFDAFGDVIFARDTKDSFDAFGDVILARDTTKDSFDAFGDAIFARDTKDSFDAFGDAIFARDTKDSFDAFGDAIFARDTKDSFGAFGDVHGGAARASYEGAFYLVLFRLILFKAYLLGGGAGLPRPRWHRQMASPTAPPERARSAHLQNGRCAGCTPRMIGSHHNDNYPTARRSLGRIPRRHGAPAMEPPRSQLG
jgi:ureidoglycolate hydrolase